MSEVSKRVSAAEAAFAPVADFYFRSRYAERRFEPGVADFTFGNPQEMPLPGFVAALREAATPPTRTGSPIRRARTSPAASSPNTVGRELGLAFEPEDFALTAGAFAAIAIAFRLVLDAGDEAIISEPAWFCYEPMLLAPTPCRGR